MAWASLLKPEEQQVIKNILGANLESLPSFQRFMVEKELKIIKLLNELDGLFPLQKRDDLPYTWGETSGLLTQVERDRVTKFCIETLYF